MTVFESRGTRQTLSYPAACWRTATRSPCSFLIQVDSQLSMLCPFTCNGMILMLMFVTLQKGKGSSKASKAEFCFKKLKKCSNHWKHPLSSELASEFHFNFIFNLGADPKSAVQLSVAGCSHANWCPGSAEPVGCLSW